MAPTLTALASHTKQASGSGLSGVQMQPPVFTHARQPSEFLYDAAPACMHGLLLLARQSETVGQKSNLLRTSTKSEANDEIECALHAA